MVAKLNQPQTSIVDLPEENRELSTDELPLIVGGGLTWFGPSSSDSPTVPGIDARKEN